MRSTVLALCIALLYPGCGDYIDAEDYSGPGGTGALTDFPEVSTLAHYQFAALMQRYTRTSADFVLLDYKALAADGEGRYLLGQYLGALAAVDPSKLASPPERLAYWVNGYNAAVILGVVESFNDDPSFKVTDSGSFFDTPIYTFGGKKLTLNQVENLVARGDTQHPSSEGLDSETSALLQKWHQELWPDGKVDARIHAAFNCGALSCPNLPDGAPYVFTAATLEQQLADYTRKWLDSDKGASDAGISQIFFWYGSDFEADAGSVEAFIAKHRTNGTSGVELKKYLEYDWTLNIVK